MKLQSLLLLGIFLLGFAGLSQPTKKIEAAIELYDTDAIKAIEKLRALIDKEKEARVDAWELLVEMYEGVYNYASSEENPKRQELQQYYNYLNFKRDSVIGIDESLRSTDDKILLGEIENEMVKLEDANLLLHANEYEAFVAVCRESTLRSTATKGDMHLRTLYLPANPDTFTVDAKEMELYNDVNDLLNAGKYSSAEILMEGLKEKYPSSYSINLSYYWYYAYQEQMDSAKAVLGRLIEWFPEILGPREHLARISYSSGDYYGAKKQVNEMMVRFAGQDIKNYYREILAVENKVLSEQRINRNFEPNRIGTVHGLVPEEWQPYRDAKIEIADKTSERGYIFDAEGNVVDYLELYSWRKLLDHHREKKPEFLEAAYKMEELGYLDCYVMYSMFHFDFFEQYEHWGGKNKKRIIDYIELYLVQYAAPEEK